MAKFQLPALNALRAFEAAARHQSMKKAATELHINHAAVSRHILNDRSFAEWQEYVACCSSTIDINVRAGVIFSDTAHCLQAASRGQGVAIGDDFLAEMHLSEGRLVRPFQSSFLSKNSYYFIVPDIVEMHPVVSSFRTWLFRSVESVRAD